MDNLKDTLLQICPPTSELIDFFVNRMFDNHYRGIHLSQHNRYLIDDVYNILKELNKYGKMEILIGDDNGVYSTTINDYKQFVDDVNKINGKGTLNSVKKTLFPDFHRMGLIKRYNEKGEEIDPYSRTTIKFVQIDKLGIKMINSQTTKDKYFCYLQAIQKLSNGLIETIKDLLVNLYDNDSREKRLTLDEFLLFITGINQTFSGKFYTSEHILKLIKDWRRLSKFTKESIKGAVRNWCDDIHKLTGINKTQDRDWHNWVNESQQIISLFSQTSFFEMDSMYSLCLRFDNNSMYSDITEAKRSLIEKHKYFEHHSITKDHACELHHIVSLYEAETIAIWKLLDVWENMIYITGTPHNNIHGKNYYKCYKLSFNGNNIKLTSIFKSSEFVICQYPSEVKYDINLKNIMLKKNNELLTTI